MNNGETPTPSEHPAKKLMQYPIDSDADGIPASVIRDPELARELADNENDFHNRADEALDEGNYFKSLTASANAAKRIVSAYYQAHDTNRLAVKKAIQHDDPAWLDPKHPQRLAEQREQERRERQYAKSVETLGVMRHRARQTDIKPDVSRLDRPIRGSYEQRINNSNDELYYGGLPYHYGPYATILKEISYGAKLEGYDNRYDFPIRVLQKFQIAEEVLHDASQQKYEEIKSGQSPKVGLKIAFEALALDVSSLRQKINDAIRNGVVSPQAGLEVFDSFDLARYSAVDFDRIKGAVDAEGSNVEALLSELYETDEEKIQESLEIEEKQQALRVEANEKHRQRLLQAQQDRRIEQAEQRVREKAAMEKFLIENPNLINGREPFKQKVAQQYPEVAEAVKHLDVNEEYRAEFDTIDSLGAAMTAFTINASEQVEPTPGTAITMPLGKTDIAALWRDTFNKPKNYFGGQAGKGRIAIRPVQEEDIVGFKAKYQLDLTDNLFAVDMTIQGVKNGQVQIESTLHGVLSPMPDPNFPIERYIFIPLKSTFEADQERLERERQGSIQVARAVEATSMLRSVSGTRSPAQRRR
ncbi:MAG: hypothetical protein V4611_04760 [Patescibacteria group bacterium]